MNKNLLIVVAYHKQSHIVSDSIYLPMQVGAAVSDIDLNMAKDNDNDNISVLNPYYCEMTALYSLWKNYPNAEFYGLAHYRRFLTYRNKLWNNLFQYTFYGISKIVHIFNLNFHFSKLPYVLVNEKNIDEELKSFSCRIQQEIERKMYDFYCAENFRFSDDTNYTKFAFTCGYQRLDEMRKIVREYHPEYLSSLDESLKSNKSHAANIAIFRKELFNRYATFVFDVLERHLKMNVQWEQDNPKYDKLYLRESGFLAEILTDTFIRKLQKEGKKGKQLRVLYYVPSQEIVYRNVMAKWLTKFGIFHVKFLK